MRKVNIRLFLSMTFFLALGACQQQWIYGTARDQRSTATVHVDEAQYDVPPQVVYRIDDHRFVTLENYNHCLGDTWYNNTQTGVRTKIGLTWITGFRGRLVIDDPTEMNVAIPTVERGLCGDKGCRDYVAYSTDGGRTFNWTRYDFHDHSFDPVVDSDRYLITVVKDSMYVTVFREKYNGVSFAKGSGNSVDYDPQSDASTTDRFPLARGYVYGRNAQLPEGVGIQFNTALPSGFRTPSGADRFICDASIHDPNSPE